MRSKEDKKGYRLTGYSRLGWRLNGGGPPTNGTTRDRAEAVLSCMAHLLRSKSLRGRDSQGGLSGGDSLESVREGERLWFIYSLSGALRCQAGASFKKVKEGVVGQPSLTGVWAVSMAT